MYTTKCAFCKQQKSDVIWHFLWEIGCKSCADKYFEGQLNSRN